MKSLKIVHHPNNNADTFSDVSTEIEAFRTANALTAISADAVLGVDNVLIKSDGTGRKAQATGIVVDDSNNVSAIGTLAAATLNPTNALALAKGGTGVLATSAPAAFDALAPTTTRGDLIVRGASSNGRLAVGAANAILASDGTDWNASSKLGITTIASGSLPAAATLDIADIPATYAYLVLQITDASSDTASRQVLVQISTDNGLNFDATAGNYKGHVVSAGAVVDWSVASLVQSGNVAAAATGTYRLQISCYQGGAYPLAQNQVNSTGFQVSTGNYIGSTSAINALRILWNGSGNFDAGTYALYGVR